MSMSDFLFDKSLELFRVITVHGRDVQNSSGLIATRDVPRDFDLGFFSNTTLILGSPEGKSSATWYLQVKEPDILLCENGYLIVACERSFGGIHSPKYGKSARIFWNDVLKNTIPLESTPQGHEDYFHSPQRYPLPEIQPIVSCGTTYWWPLNRADFRFGDSQIVRIEVDANVLWDIDYICLVTLKRQKKVRKGVKKVFWFIVAVSGWLIKFFGDYILSLVKQ